MRSEAIASQKHGPFGSGGDRQGICGQRFGLLDRPARFR
jgi:hypothetical protein